MRTSWADEPGPPAPVAYVKRLAHLARRLPVSTAFLRVPLGMRSVLHRRPVHVGFAVFPPDQSPLAQDSLSLVNGMARFRYGPLIAGGFGILDGSPDVRQFARKNRRALGIEFRVLIRQSLPPTTKYSAIRCHGMP